ncbi:hypothetical protein [Methanobrevibacter sp.]|uniref:hypothetical protein n=1 Tax=Methanobrevibacter sp. TaxID=66852 RepID=UPI00386AE643
MHDKFVKHIRRKLYDKDEILNHFDVPTDEQIEYLMLTTFEVVENECQKCFFCKNFKRFSMGSLCKIKPHTQKNCFHFSLDINKILKKKYYKILTTLSECTRGRYIIDKNISTKAQKNIIYESIKIYEMLQCYKEINNV